MAIYQDRKGKVFKTKEEARQSNKAMDQLSAPNSVPLSSGTNAEDIQDALDYGASGAGEFLTPEDSAKADKAFELGVPKSELGSPTGNKKNPYERIIDKPSKYKEPSLSVGQVSKYVSSFGLAGIVDPKKYAGKTPSQVNEILMRERRRRTDQISQNTSFAFNPETLKRTQRAVDKFNFALDEADKDPFEPKKFKEDTKGNIIEVTSKELGQLFTNPDQVFSEYKTNPQLKVTFDKFIKKGGTLEGIAKNVATQPTQDNQITNQMVDQGQLPADQREGNVQSPSDYLAGLTNPTASREAERKALDELSPESDIAQEEIMRQSKIPAELKSLYFGDEKSIGILQMKRDQAVEEVRLLEEKERDEKRTARDKAQLQIQKNKAEAKAAESEIEQNRIAAKNYMTNRLAQLGALQTTGAAVLALQTLETKYQIQTTNLRTKLKFANRELEVGLSEDIDKIENDVADNIIKIQEDLTKDSETVAKDVLKAQNEAEKEVYRITEQYSRRLRERTTSFTDKLKAEAEKYAKEYAKRASGGIDFTSAGSPASKSKIVTTIENVLESSRGKDGYVNSEEYARQYKAWVAKGGTAKTFTTAFPPKLYANPDDTSLPPNLQYARESQTLKKEKDSDEISFDEI